MVEVDPDPSKSINQLAGEIVGKMRERIMDPTPEALRDTYEVIASSGDRKGQPVDLRLHADYSWSHKSFFELYHPNPTQIELLSEYALTEDDYMRSQVEDAMKYGLLLRFSEHTDWYIETNERRLTMGLKRSLLNTLDRMDRPTEQ